MEISSNGKYIHTPLVSVPEAAKYLGIGRKLVYQLLEYGELRAVRRKGVIRIEKISLDEYLESGRRI